MKVILLLLVFSVYPTKPAHNAADFEIRTWGGGGSIFVDICKPHFTYRVSADKISIYYENTLIESHPDKGKMFRLLEANFDTLRKFAKMKSHCTEFDPRGIAITKNGEEISISSVSTNCMGLSSKSSKQISLIISRIYKIEYEFNKRLERKKDTRFESGCS